MIAVNTKNPINKANNIFAMDNVQDTRNNAMGSMQTGKKGGFWRRFLQAAIVGVGASLGPIGIIVASAVITAMETNTSTDENPGGNYEDSKPGAQSDYEPSASEQTILENWVTQKFNPFYKNLVSQLSTALSNPNLQIQIASLNKVQEKLCVVHSFYATQDSAGLSPAAVAYRLELIQTLLEPIATLIDDNVPHDYFVKSSTVNPIPADYAPLGIYGSAYPCQSFVKTGSTSPILEVFIPEVKILPTAPVRVLPINPPISTDPETISNPQVDVIQAGPGAIPETVNETVSLVKKNKGIVIGVGLLALYLIWPSDKKKK